MSAEMKNERGTVKITNAVIANIVGYAATKCYGVVGMATKSSKDGISKLLKHENMDKGIKIKVNEDKVSISLYIIVEYGVNIHVVGESIRSNVRYRVEEMTGLSVESINVNVESIRV